MCEYFFFFFFFFFLGGGGGHHKIELVLGVISMYRIWVFLKVNIHNENEAIRGFVCLLFVFVFCFVFFFGGGGGGWGVWIEPDFLS